MNVENVLAEIGLSEGEIKVFLALLKLGSVPVSKIKEETNLHRTTIYDFLEKLLNKSLVNYVIKNNVKYYKATHPNKLLEFVKEKEDNIQSILPNLIKISEFKKEKLRVEVYKGVEGFKTVLNDCLKVGKELVAFGVEEIKFEQNFSSHIMKQYIRKEKEKGIKERLIASENTKFIYKTLTASYRFIQDAYFNPTPTMVYGDRVVITIWNPLTNIRIENKELADAYRKHFEILWKLAKKKPKNKLKYL